jgi:predicted metal-dependent phosphoesterase TrpH
MRKGYSAADMHILTTASDGTASPREVLAFVAEHTDLSVVAICDHNTNEGAIEAAGYAHEYGVEVVVSQEVESADGHILGLWTPRIIATGLSAEATVAEIHAQGGLAIAAHPYAPRWWHKYGLCRGETCVYDAVDFDGVEIANSTPLLLAANFRARSYWRANRERLAATGGSDAHMLSVIGTSRTLFPGRTAADLRLAIERRQTVGYGPTFNPARFFVYARKVPEIQERDRDRRQREAERDMNGCAACEQCGPETATAVQGRQS